MYPNYRSYLFGLVGLTYPRRDKAPSDVYNHFRLRLDALRHFYHWLTKLQLLTLHRVVKHSWSQFNQNFVYALAKYYKANYELIKEIISICIYKNADADTTNMFLTSCFVFFVIQPSTGPFEQF